MTEAEITGAAARLEELIRQAETINNGIDDMASYLEARGDEDCLDRMADVRNDVAAIKSLLLKARLRAQGMKVPVPEAA